MYAMKILKKSEVCKRHQVEHTRTERKIMAEINVRCVGLIRHFYRAHICLPMQHPFVLRMRYSFQTQSQLFMVTDFCAGGELFFHLKRLRRFSEGMVRFYAAQISVALAHLHSHNILYRDLKPENVNFFESELISQFFECGNTCFQILLDRNGNCKLTDFGLSKVCSWNISRSLEGYEFACSDLQRQRRQIRNLLRYS